MMGPSQIPWILERAALARAVRGRRELLGISLREACLQMGIPPSSLGRVENGRVMDVDTLLAVCQWVGLPVDAFVIKRAQ